MATRAAAPGPTGRNALLAYLAVIVTIVSWASAFAAIRVGLRHLSPIELAAARYCAAAVPAGHDAVRLAIDYALVKLKNEGTLDELYLRWFPVSFY